MSTDMEPESMIFLAASYRTWVYTSDFYTGVPNQMEDE